MKYTEPFPDLVVTLGGDGQLLLLQFERTGEPKVNGKVHQLNNFS